MSCRRRRRRRRPRPRACCRCRSPLTTARARAPLAGATSHSAARTRRSPISACSALSATPICSCSVSTRRAAIRRAQNSARRPRRCCVATCTVSDAAARPRARERPLAAEFVNETRVVGCRRSEQQPFRSEQPHRLAARRARARGSRLQAPTTSAAGALAASTSPRRCSSPTPPSRGTASLCSS